MFQFYICTVKGYQKYRKQQSMKYDAYKFCVLRNEKKTEHTGWGFLLLVIDWNCCE
jgi:hypothetical protein